MPSRIVVQAVVATALVFVGLRVAVTGAPESLSGWAAPLGPATAAAWAGLLVFDSWAWRLAPIRKVTKRPLLHGTWHGTLHSHWVDPTTNQRVSPDDNVFLAIEQRFWSVSVCLLSKESDSVTLVSGFEGGTSALKKLHFIYRNTPRTGVQHRSQPHLGAATIEAPVDLSRGFRGDYFTNRSPHMTRGELHMTTRYPKVAGSHRVACGMVEDNK
jgi:hypothetical protein